MIIRKALTGPTRRHRGFHSSPGRACGACSVRRALADQKTIHGRLDMRWRSKTYWWFEPIRKILVNWDDDIPNIWKNQKCSKPPTRKTAGSRDLWIYDNLWMDWPVWGSETIPLFVKFGSPTLTVANLLNRCWRILQTQMAFFSGSSNAAFWEFPSLGSTFLDPKSPAFWQAIL